MDLRTALLALLALGTVGAAAELVLLEHVDEWAQWVPLVLLAAALPLLAWVARRPGRPGLAALRGVMVLFVVAGVVGIALHLRSNLEFELELHPDARGWPLLVETFKGAIPALAPGLMVLLGLLGLAYCSRHPAWDRSPGKTANGDSP